MTDGLVSVIIPTFNRAAFIERCVNSVINQTYPSIEIIVIDDGSTDQTVDILKQFPKVKVIFQENLGVSCARNIGIKNSNGEFVALLDSDDEWLPEKIAKQINLLNKNPSLMWVHSNEEWIRDGQRVKQLNKHKKGGGDQFIRSLDLCVISPSCCILKRSLFDKHGLFNEDYTVCEDYDLWLRLGSIYEIGFIDEVLTIKYGGHEDQLSMMYFAMDYWRIKSLNWVLRNRKLTEDKRLKTINVLIKKSERLLKGYRKHNNLINVSEIEHILFDFKN
jgi:glycosyltransferase involved in cell wall biosynthesis